MANDTTVKGFDAVESALIRGSLADAFKVAIALQDLAADVDATETTINANEATIAPRKAG